MTREDFLKYLHDHEYFHTTSGDTIIIDGYDVMLSRLTSIPPNITFVNNGDVNLESLESIPKDIVFKNRGNVDLGNLTSISGDVQFRNEKSVWIGPLRTIPKDLEFNNGWGTGAYNAIGDDFAWHVYLDRMGTSTYRWKGVIEGINGIRLLNLMIKKELFV